MSSRAGSLWRQIFNVQCPYKRKASVKATRASLCYSEPCWLFAFADMLWSRWIITFCTNKTQISNVFLNVCAVLKLKQNIFHTFHKGTDSLWASSIYGPPLQMFQLGSGSRSGSIVSIGSLCCWVSLASQASGVSRSSRASWASGPPRTSGPPCPFRTHGPPRPPSTEVFQEGLQHWGGLLERLQLTFTYSCAISKWKS